MECMVRIWLVLVCLSGALFAHGGSYRPPPRPLAGDPHKPHLRMVPGVTARRSVGTPLQPWEYWWRLNREELLRLRERVAKRTVITGARVDKRSDRARLRDEKLLPVMIEALRSDDEEIRTAAAVALGKFRAPKARRLLLDVLMHDKTKQVREAAMLGLILLRDPQLAAPFRMLAKDHHSTQSSRIRAWALLGLGFLGERAFLAEVVSSADQDDQQRSVAALALGFCGSPAAAPLATTLMDRRAPQGARGFAGSGLARIRSPLVEPELLKIIEDRHSIPMARYGAAIAAGRVFAPDRLDAIDRLGKKAGRDPDRALRSLLVMSLGRIGGDRAASHIVAAHKTMPRNAGFAYLALGLSGADGAGDVLMSMFDRIRNANQRGACALGLALAGHKKAAPKLRAHLKRANPAFLPHGMVALGLLDDPKAIKLIREVLDKNRDPVVRREAALALALLRRAGAVPELVDLYGKSKSTFLRSAIASALGLIGAESAVDPLLAIYRDETRQSEERAIALAALGRIGDLDPIPLLARMAIDLNPYVRPDAILEALSVL